MGTLRRALNWIITVSQNPMCNETLERSSFCQAKASTLKSDDVINSTGAMIKTVNGLKFHTNFTSFLAPFILIYYFKSLWRY